MFEDPTAQFVFAEGRSDTALGVLTLQCAGPEIDRNKETIVHCVRTPRVCSSVIYRLF